MQYERDSSKGERILEAAARLMRQKSFKEISMDELAAEAGVAKGTLYLYFRSKSEIYFSLLVEKVNAFSRVVNKVAQEKDLSAMDSISRIFDESYKAFEAHPDAQQIPILAVPEVTPEKLEEDIQSSFFPQLDQLKQDLCSVFKKGTESGEFKSLDPLKLAGLFLHLLEYCYVHSLVISDTPSDPKEEMEFVKEVLFRGLKT